MEQRLKTRDDLARHLSSKMFTGLAAEVGVFGGDYSSILKSHWRGILMLIDSWRHWHENYLNDVANSDHESHIKRMAEVAMKFVERSDVVMVRASSGVAANLLADESLDWVYIDANHSYQSVVQDIHAWLPKVRRGGILAGHDYGAPPEVGFGVKQAVDEIFGLRVKTTLDAYSSWYVDKL